MKKLFTIISISISSFLFAQPSNDNPCGAVPIDVNNGCVTTSSDNIGATDYGPTQIVEKKNKFIMKFKGVIPVEFPEYRRYLVYFYVFDRHRWSYQVSDRSYLNHEYYTVTSV